MNIRPTEAPISLIARSPQLAQDAVEAVITLPTFKRPAQLLETLASLKAQATARRYAIVVIENEAVMREGAAAAAPLFEHGELPGLLIVAHHCLVLDHHDRVAPRGRLSLQRRQRLEQLGGTLEGRQRDHRLDGVLRELRRPRDQRYRRLGGADVHAGLPIGTSPVRYGSFAINVALNTFHASGAKARDFTQRLPEIAAA